MRSSENHKENGLLSLVVQDSDRSDIDFNTVKPQSLAAQSWEHFRTAINDCPAAQTYLTERKLCAEVLDIGFFNGQLPPALIELSNQKQPYRRKKHWTEYAFKQKHQTQARGNKASVVFPLRAFDGRVAGLYYRAIDPIGKHDRHLYPLGHKGLYPGYPPRSTKRLLVTESVIDAATIEMDEILQAEFGVLALYGTYGFNDEHISAIEQLNNLEELVLALDGDKAGHMATRKLAGRIREFQPNLQISRVDLPPGEDINSLLVNTDFVVLRSMIEMRRPFTQSDFEEIDRLSALKQERKARRTAKVSTSYRKSGRPADRVPGPKPSKGSRVNWRDFKYRYREPLFLRCQAQDLQPKSADED